jgi:hypothetical protein
MLGDRLSPVAPTPFPRGDFHPFMVSQATWPTFRVVLQGIGHRALARAFEAEFQRLWRAQ